MTCPAPRVRNYLHLLSHHVVKHQRGLNPCKQPPGILWRLPSPHHYLGRTGCRRRKTNKRGTSLLEEIPSCVRLPHSWRAVTSVMFRWPRRVLSNVILTCHGRRRDRGKHGDGQTLQHLLCLLSCQKRPSRKVLRLKAEEDCHSHTSEESTDQNPPHDSDLNKDELLGPLADISIPGGHSDGSVALVVFPGDDDL